jgi:serine/threonine-protein kinase
MIGQILRGYRIVEKIKDGSVGTVWKALNSRNQACALKILAEKHLAHPERVRQFRKEALLTQKLHHPGIVKVYEYVDSRRPFFAMEYFESENLKYSIWHLPDRVYKYEFRLMRQIADALEFSHRAGVVHKDVKPENVLVSARAEARLIDFSLSQGRWDRLLQFGRRVEGTPLYMAPEQIRGEKCDPRADQYSFGVMLYELLTKRPPFLGTTEQNLFHKHLKEPPAPLRSFVKTLSPELDAIVLRMLEKKPADRFPDMTTAIYELTKWEKKDTVIRLRQVEPARPREGGPPGPPGPSRP